MDKIKSIQKYTTIISIATGVLIAINLFNGNNLRTEFNNNEKIMSQVMSNENIDNKKDYRIVSPSQTDYSLALIDIFNTKLNFIYTDLNSIYKNSEIDSYINSQKDILFINSKLSKESSIKYQQFEDLSSIPISKEDITYAKNVLTKGNSLYENIDKYDFISPSFKKIFKENLEQLSLLSNSNQSIEIINIYRENINNKEFQDLIVNQDTENLWNKYFKEKFGEKVSDIAYLQDGSFYQKAGL